MKIAFIAEVLHWALLKLLQRSILYSGSSLSSSATDLLYLRLLVFSRSSGVTNLKVWVVTWYFLMAYIISLFEDHCDLEGELLKDKKWFGFFVMKWVFMAGLVFMKILWDNIRKMKFKDITSVLDLYILEPVFEDYWRIKIRGLLHIFLVADLFIC